MNSHLKEAFSRMKPLCDLVMVAPTQQHIANYESAVKELEMETLQELQQYLLYPFITHLQSNDIRTRYELQGILISTMTGVLQRVHVFSYEMCFKIETILLSLVFDKSRLGMIADVPEELKLVVMKCLTALLLNVDVTIRLKLLQTQMPLLAQAIFLAVHMAKLEKLRQLRIAAMDCLNAHTATHPQLTDSNCLIKDATLEKAVLNSTSSILPGVLAALQDVATSTDNPGHAVVVAALNTTHRIMCLTMHNKHLSQNDVITTEDFVKMISSKARTDKDVSSHVNSKDMVKFSPQWYEMAGEKLSIVVKSLVTLVSHDHYRVRKELAVLCYRILSECSRTMQPSLSMALDVLISLSNDQYEEVSEYCTKAVGSYFSSTKLAEYEAVDILNENFYTALNNLPKVLNNIDSNRKLSALNLVLGYLRVLPQQTSVRPNETALALLAAVSLTAPSTLLATHAIRDVTSVPPTNSPWVHLSQLDSPECEQRLQQICRMLGELQCAELLLDTFLQMFHDERTCELIYIINWFGSAQNSNADIARRIITAYIQEDVWYCSFEVGEDEPDITEQDTLDVTVYNPRAWQRDSVPGLYEGTVESRYTDISYGRARAVRRGRGCGSLAAAQRHVLRACLLVEGLGHMANRLGRDYQPFLLNTLCLILERVGSKYEMLHLAGLKAINDVAGAFGHAHISELIGENADYFTSQITARLKKAWNIESALQILSVVMEYSQPDILHYLYGIVEDVLVQSCDKYYQKNLYSYLQVFYTFVSCIRKWFNIELKLEVKKDTEKVNVFDEVMEFAKNFEESEQLLKVEESEESKKSAEEMYKEDLKKREEDELDYDDTVTKESPPLPQHVKVTISIIKRSIHFVTSKQKDEAVLALQVLDLAFPVLAHHENELLPLVHQAWSPLVARFDGDLAVVLKALDLLVTLAILSKDFIRNRAIKEVLPKIYLYLEEQSAERCGKGSALSFRVSLSYRVRARALSALAVVTRAVALERGALRAALAAARPYLSRRELPSLQELAVKFYKDMLEYDYSATWQFLRQVCGNRQVQAAPQAPLPLQPVTGTPYEPCDELYRHNVTLIFAENK